ncbi:MAG: glycosyltransferase family 39 protein [Chloroflexota bacterium]
MRSTLVAIAILLLAFFLRTYQLDAQSIWWDEGHSIQMASAPILEIPTLPGMDVHPPGFFVSLHLWMDWLGHSKFTLRYLSVIFSILTVALALQFGRRLGYRWLGEWVAVLMAVSPFYITYAQEVRMYAMVTFFGLGSMFGLWRLVFTVFNPFSEGLSKNSNLGSDSRDFSLPQPLPLRGESKTSPLAGEAEGGRDIQTTTTSLASRETLWSTYKNPLILYILFTTACLYTHYFTIFLLAFQNFVWLLWFWRDGVRAVPQDWRNRLGLWFGSQLAILILFTPQLNLALRQVTTYTNPNLNPPTWITFLTHSWHTYTLGVTTAYDQAQIYLIVLLLILTIGLLLLARRLIWWFTLFWFVIPMGLYFIVLQQQPSFEPRYLSLITPAIFLLLGMVLASHRRAIWLGIAVVGILIFGTYTYFTAPALQKDDADAVTKFLQTETTPSDVVLVDVPHPFHYYANQIPASTDYLFVDVHTAADMLNELASGHDRLFWVTWWGSDTDPRGVIPYLLQKQAGPGSQLGEKQFRGYHVRWHQLSDQSFSLPNTLTPIAVNFDNQIVLDGIAFSSSIPTNQDGWATLHFSQLAPMTVNYKLSLRLRSPEGAMLAQQDKLLLNDRHFQTAAWPLDDPALNHTINVYTLTLDDPSYRGPAILEAVVYNAETLAAIAAYGVATTNEDFVSAQLGQIEIGP